MTPKSFVFNFWGSLHKCLPPLPLFTSDNKRAIIKRRVLDRLCDWFDRFFDIFKFE